MDKKKVGNIEASLERIDLALETIQGAMKDIQEARRDITDELHPEQSGDAIFGEVETQ